MQRAINVSAPCLLLLTLIMPTPASVVPAFGEPVSQFRVFCVDALGTGRQLAHPSNKWV
jgi:hypothetical protein